MTMHVSVQAQAVKEDVNTTTGTDIDDLMTRHPIEPRAWETQMCSTLTLQRHLKVVR